MFLSSFSDWLKAASRKSKGSHRAKCSRRARCVPRLEFLEDRTVPSTFVVRNLNDSGTGSLRAANGGSILIDAGATLNLDQFLVANNSAYNLAPGGIYNVPITGTGNAPGIANAITALRNDLDSENEISEMTSMQLQLLMDTRSKLLQTVSQIEMAISDIQMAIVGNIQSSE